MLKGTLSTQVSDGREIKIRLEMQELGWLHWLFCVQPEKAFNANNESGRSLTAVRDKLKSSLAGLEGILDKILIEDYLRSNEEKRIDRENKK